MAQNHSLDQKEHPVAGYDFKAEEIEGDVLCACPTIDSLLNWFDGYMDELLDEGFRVYEISVSKATISKSGLQVVIREEDILSIREMK